MPSRTRKKKKDREFWPPKYYKGLTLRQKQIRKKEIEKFGAKDWKNPAAYREFRSDAFIPSKSSSYTKEWKKQFPDALSLQDKAKATGVPLKTIKASYDRGMAAWRTGHRPGATEQQWGYARVHSFLLCGKTYHTTDSDLARKAKATSAKARKWFKRCNTSRH
jgi:hypothetical protein